MILALCIASKWHIGGDFDTNECMLSDLKWEHGLIWLINYFWRNALLSKVNNLTSIHNPTHIYHNSFYSPFQTPLGTEH